MLRIFVVLAGLSLPASALAASQQPIEPIDVPPSVEQGLDIDYIDPEISPSLEPWSHCASVRSGACLPFCSSMIESVSLARIAP